MKKDKNRVAGRKCWVVATSHSGAGDSCSDRVTAEQRGS